MPEGEYELFSVPDTHLEFIKRFENWNAARDHCKERGKDLGKRGDLASLPNEKHRMAVRDEIDNTNREGGALIHDREH